MSKNNGVATIQDRLRAHPDRRTITLAGVEHDFLLGTYGIRLAKEQGVDALEALQEIAQLEHLSVDMMEAFAKVLYAGLIPFQPSLSFEMVCVDLSFAEIQRMQEMIEGEMFAINDGAEPMEEGGQEGN